MGAEAIPFGLMTFFLTLSIGSAVLSLQAGGSLVETLGELVVGAASGGFMAYLGIAGHLGLRHGLATRLEADQSALTLFFLNGEKRTVRFSNPSERVTVVILPSSEFAWLTVPLHGPAACEAKLRCEDGLMLVEFMRSLGLRISTTKPWWEGSTIHAGPPGTRFFRAFGGSARVMVRTFQIRPGVL